MPEIEDYFLSESLVSVTCSAAATMMGRKGGVTKLLLKCYLKLVVWHCLSHRLELNIGDQRREVAGINYFKVTMDNIRALYYYSSKSQ
jgi:hypothetical protein